MLKCDNSHINSIEKPFATTTKTSLLTPLICAHNFLINEFNFIWHKVVANWLVVATLMVGDKLKLALRAIGRELRSSKGTRKRFLKYG